VQVSYLAVISTQVSLTSLGILLYIAIVQVRITQIFLSNSVDLFHNFFQD